MRDPYPKPLLSDLWIWKIRSVSVLCAMIAFCGQKDLASEEAQQPKWWKGNLHTHTLWSDGDDYPEMVAKWYKDHGYDFLVLSDHNVYQNVDRWTNPEKNKGGIRALQRYEATFGEKWVVRRHVGDTMEVRLRTLSEIQAALQVPGAFLLVPGEEVTARYLTSPIHMNATNLQSLITPLTGESVVDVLQKNVDQVWEQRRLTGEPILIHLNHPNFGWGITAEELMQVKGENFFEVYNGHPAVHNIGDEIHASTERMWDIILTWRLAVLDMDPMYGIATDDSHSYFSESRSDSISGRGWVTVQSERLHPTDLVQSMELGRFYASCGVEIDQMTWNNNEPLHVKPKKVEGEDFLFQFIGTRR
ncbi:MAG: histidinol-phosphatase, partial [Verrucomicrobia bacterium]|nr:histidinol-phosphatase [Verrucomicrobiota bacterium]